MVVVSGEIYDRPISSCLSLLIIIRLISLKQEKIVRRKVHFASIQQHTQSGVGSITPDLTYLHIQHIFTMADRWGRKSVTQEENYKS